MIFKNATSQVLPKSHKIRMPGMWWGLGYAFLTSESRSDVQSLRITVSIFFFWRGRQEWEGGDNKSMLKENGVGQLVLKSYSGLFFLASQTTGNKGPQTTGILTTSGHMRESCYMPSFPTICREIISPAVCRPEMTFPKCGWLTSPRAVTRTHVSGACHQVLPIPPG